jgi:hypothetical protein
MLGVVHHGYARGVRRKAPVHGAPEIFRTGLSHERASNLTPVHDAAEYKDP